MHRVIAIWAITMLAGCSSMTPTKQKEASFVIFDVQSTSINRSQLLDAVTQAVQKHQSKLQISRDIQTGALPDTPQRFVLKDPFANSSIGAMMAASGQSMKTPVCENPILTLASGNSSASGDTTFFLCVVPYKAGYSINIYSTFSSTSGGFSVNALSSALAKSIAGDSSQFIPRAMNEVRTAAESVGGKVSIIDSYIPESFKGSFVNQTASLNK